MPDQRQDDDEAPTAPRPAGEGVRILGAQEAAAREAELNAGRLPDDAPKYGDVPPQPSGPRPAVRLPLPDDGARPTPAAGLPHWTEPPTGEVPKILAGDSEDDDLEAWSGLTSRAPRWRGDQQGDWEEADFEDASLLGDDEERVGALDEKRTEHSDLFTFDEPDDEPPARATHTIRTRPADTDTIYGNGGGSERDIAMAVATGVAVALVAAFCFWRGPAFVAFLATVVVVAAAAEVFDVFRRKGYRPATLLGLVATASLMIGAYARGERAVPLIIALTIVFTMLWYLAGVVRGRPTVNVAATIMGFMWVGFLGSFSTLLLRHTNREGLAFLLGAIVAVVANDIGALLSGRQWGATPLAPEVSPNKTWEGLVGGLVASLIVCAFVVSQVHPWSLGAALALAIVVSVVGPVGDLCESMIKRDLGVKDTGALLPGHGGVLDRFDAMLFCLPAVYYLVELLNLPGS